MSQKSTEFEQWLVLRFPSREYEEVEPEPEKPSASDRDVGGGPNDPDSIRSKCVAPAVLLLLPRLGGGGGVTVPCCNARHSSVHFSTLGDRATLGAYTVRAPF
jgi:hypothetical protein